MQFQRRQRRQGRRLDTASAHALFVVNNVQMALVSHHGEIFRFGLWMTAVAYVVILLVAVPYWGLVGEPLTRAATPTGR